MTDESTDGPSILPAAVLAIVAAVLFVVSLFGGGDFMLLASVILGAVSALRAQRVRQLHSLGNSELLESRMIELQDGLDDAQQEIKQLRDAQEFDRELGLPAGEKDRAGEDVS